MNKTRPLFLVYFFLLSSLFAFNSYADEVTIEWKGGTYTGELYEELFGKKKRRPGDLLTQSSVLFDENNEESTWWSIVENARNPDVAKEDVVAELFHLKMFAVELAIDSSFNGEVKQSMRDELYRYTENTMPRISNELVNRQQIYRDAWKSHSLLHLPKSYSVIKRFSELCNFDPDPVVQRSLTKIFVNLITSMQKYFSGIQEIYQIVPSEDVSSGIPHGIGSWIHPSGFQYVGDWKYGNRHGEGTYIYPDRSKYVGEWRDHNFHGQGTYTFVDGRKYVGEWKDSKMHGQGTLTTDDGYKYVGGWNDGNQWNGTEYDKDGNVTGTFADGVKTEK